MENATVIDIKNFFNTGASTPVKIKEMTDFWKSATEEEKADYRRSLQNWDGKSFYC